MKYKIKEKGEVNLSKKDFIASGGEGKIYVHGDKAFKIYMKPERMIPEQKIQELSAIRNPNVIRPEDVLLSKNTPVGYSMRYVRDTHALCQLFTKAFKKRNNLSPDMILNLVKGMQDGVEDIHGHGILIVDLNEMNFLVDKTFKEVYFIDADSYQTSHFPATALMDSVKDWHANGKWTEGSDWFSWAVVSFQLFTGIHPYKGKHSVIKSMVERMQKNISVFNLDVAVPKMVPSFDTIPEVFRKWYKAVFDRGSREMPPVGLQAVAHVAATTRHLSSTAKIEISDVFKFRFASDVVSFQRLGEFDVTRTKYGVIIVSSSGVRSEYSLEHSASSVISITRKGRLVLGVLGPGGSVDLVDLKSNKAIPITSRCDAMMEYEGRIYLKNGENLLEVDFVDHCNDLCLATTKTVANVMPKATKLFEGVAIQDMLGSGFASFFPRSGASYQMKLDELDGYKIIDAKFDSRVLMIIGSKSGKYDKFIFRFERDFQNYVLWKEKDIAYAGINFIVLDNGICAHINEDEELMLFSSSPSQDGVKKVADPMLGGDMRLFKRGNEVLFARGKEICKLSMKK